MALKGDFPVDEETFAFGSFRLIPAQRELLEDGKPLRLGARAFDILVTLVESAGETIRRDQLIARAWPDTVVDDGALRVHVAALRKALGDGRGGNRFIANIPGRGYTFVAPVGREQPQQTAAPPNRPGLGGNLPAQLTRVIGRVEIIATMVARTVQQRFLTIVGPGGIGKTTVAVAAGEALNGSYEHGVWFVGLASLQDPALVPGAISAAVGSTPGVGDPLSSLVAWLRGKRALIILDNCEHVINAAAATVEVMLKAAPQVAILATSREPLRAEGEWLLRLPSLEVPPAGNGLTAAEALSFPAVELFTERAAAALGGMGLADADIPAVLEICRHLDGVPLAIELAAAQVDVFGVRSLAARLDDRLVVLTRGRRTALPRQQTLRATIDWSYELLPEAERRLLCRLAVFPAGFALEAAAAVMSQSDDDAAVVGEGIANLVAKSLVSRDGSTQPGRWRLLETIRAYALEKLAESGELDAASRQHAEFFRDLIVPAGTNEVLQLSIDDVARYGREIDNVRAAIDWSFSPSGDIANGVDLTAAYVPVWLHLSLMQECRERCERALRALAPKSASHARLQMWLQIGLGNSLLHTRGPSEQAQTVLTEALESAEALGDLSAQLRVLLDLASVTGFRGEYARAAAASERVGAIAQQIGDTTGVVFADRRMGMILLRTGRLAEAQRYFERVIQSPPLYRNEDRLPIRRHSDDRAMARALLARALWLQGFPERAYHEAQASLSDIRGSDHQLTMCRVLFYGMDRITPMTGDFAAAETAISSIIELATSAAAPFWATVGQFLRGKLLVERHQFAEGLAALREAFDTCNQTGWRLSYPEFMGSFALALAGLGRLDEAHDAVCKAIEAAGEGKDDQQWYIPELLRIRGEVLLRQTSNQAVQAAADCFAQAAEMARKQGALSWELRVALSLARLLRGQGRSAEAVGILRPVYDRFTEGFATADLQQAKCLLEQLALAD